MGFLGGSVVKKTPANAGETGSTPGLGRPPGEGNGNWLQYSCLENPMDRGAWQAIVYGVAKSRIQLSDWTTIPYYSVLLNIWVDEPYLPFSDLKDTSNSLMFVTRLLERCIKIIFNPLCFKELDTTEKLTLSLFIVRLIVWRSFYETEKARIQWKLREGCSLETECLLSRPCSWL